MQSQHQVSCPVCRFEMKRLILNMQGDIVNCSNELGKHLASKFLSLPRGKGIIYPFPEPVWPPGWRLFRARLRAVAGGLLRHQMMCGI